MIYGTFDSRSGVYGFEVNGRMRYYKPLFYANNMRHAVLDIYNTLMRGVDGGSNPGWPNGIFVTNESRWRDRIEPHYPGLYAQSQLHYYDDRVTAGQVPNWVLPWEQSGFRFIHEYSPGRIVLVRPMVNYDNDILMFFEPADEPDQNDSTVNVPDSIPGGNMTTPVVSLPSIPSEININVHVYHHKD